MISGTQCETLNPRFQMQKFKPKKTHKQRLNSENAHAHPRPYFIFEKHTLETYKSNKLVYKDILAFVR